MKKLIYLIVFLALLTGCKNFEVPESMISKEANAFSLHFFDLIYQGHIDSCLQYIEEDKAAGARMYLENIHKDIRHWEIKDTAVVSYARNKNVDDLSTLNLYTITYDFEFDEASCMFEITSDRKKNVFTVTSFNFQLKED